MWLTVTVVALITALDQLSKWWAVCRLAPVGSRPLWPGVVRLHYTLNDGAAFSMFAGRQTLLILLTSAALVGMLAWLVWRRPRGLYRWGIACIVGGGLGNLIDRVLNGAVVDFFDVEFMRFAVFNVADSFVTVGCILLFLGILLEDVRAKRAARRRTAAAQAADTQEDGMRAAAAQAADTQAADTQAPDRQAAAAPAQDAAARQGGPHA